MSTEKPTIKIKKWMPVAMWSLNMKIEVCAICRNHIMDICVECQDGSSEMEEECSIAWGKCNHAFHYHCISRWLKNKLVCPLDSKTWIFKN